jgi:magnesium-transporting ATPase (P-type)
MTDRDASIEQCAEKIETDLTLIGSTAIEDKLQDDVANVIEFIRNAGIKLWVLTGDKIETATNIGYSCKILDNEMEIFKINEETTKKLQ